MCVWMHDCIMSFIIIGLYSAVSFLSLCDALEPSDERDSELRSLAHTNDDISPLWRLNLFQDLFVSTTATSICCLNAGHTIINHDGNMIRLS